MSSITNVIAQCNCNLFLNSWFYGIKLKITLKKLFFSMSSHERSKHTELRTKHTELKQRTG